VSGFFTVFVRHLAKESGITADCQDIGNRVLSALTPVGGVSFVRKVFDYYFVSYSRKLSHF